LQPAWLSLTLVVTCVTLPFSPDLVERAHFLMGTDRWRSGSRQRN